MLQKCSKMGLCKYISQTILLKKEAVDWIGPRRILGVFEILRFTRSARKPLGLPPSIGETIQLSNNKFPSNTFPKFEMWFPKSKFTVQQVLILLYIDIMIDSIWLRKNFFVGINYTCASLCSLPIPVCRRKIFKLQNEKLSSENIWKKKTLAWDKDREQRRKCMETFGNYKFWERTGQRWFSQQTNFWDRNGQRRIFLKNRNVSNADQMTICLKFWSN